MKKNLIFHRLTALLLVLALMLPMMLTGCTPDDNTDPTADPSGGTGPEGTLLYTIVAKGEGGMRLSGVTVTLTDNQGFEKATGTTNENGEFQAWLYPAKYTVKLDNLRPGYTATETVTDENGGVFEAIATTKLITSAYPNQPDSYAVGDVMYDFAYLKDGKEVRLSDLLKEKKVVVLNFWAMWCSNCKAEFPVINEAYQLYADDVAFVALNPEDTLTEISEYQQKNDLKFDMVNDTGLCSVFMTSTGKNAYPITVFIDRYGVVTQMIVGADTSVEAWKKEFEWYISDEYTQTGSSGYEEPDDDDTLKPDVDMPSSAEIGNAINGTGFSTTYTASDDDTVWPWVLTTVDGKNVIEPSNYGSEKPNTNAMITFDVTLDKDEVFAFDFKYSIEYDTYGTSIYDMFAVYVDGHIMQKMVTPNNPADGWVICYAYTPLEKGTHSVTLVYTKDGSDSRPFMEVGKEYVYVTNLRTLSVAEMTEAGGSMDVYRTAANGVPDKDKAETMTTEFENYVDVVFNTEDGFYHVGSADGPLLLCKLEGATQWSSTSIYSLGAVGYLMIDTINYFDLLSSNSAKGYMWLEEYSTLGYSVVDEKLSQILKLIVANVGNGKNHDKEWLELCSYFDHYGVGEGINKVTAVRLGIDEKSALDAYEGKNRAEINQVVVPRGLYYKFVPEKDGVYTFYAVSEGATTSEASSQIDTIGWLYDDAKNTLDFGDEERDTADGNHFQMWKTLKAGQTYYVAVGFDPVDTLGAFDFYIEYVGEKYDVLTTITEAWTTTEDYSSTILYRPRGTQVGLGTDGYYHQVLYYDDDGNAVLDYSETGYIYVDFIGATMAEGISYVYWPGETCTLQKYIEKGYYTYEAKDENDFRLNAFDFSAREDVVGSVRYAYLEKTLGNCQAEMEAYLKEALDESVHAKTDELYGLVKADARLAEILDGLMMIYGLLNTNTAADGSTEYVAVAEQWLMFACYYRHA